MLPVFAKKLQAFRYATLLKETSTQLVSSFKSIVKISDSNNLFEDFPAKTLAHNKSLITLTMTN